MKNGTIVYVTDWGKQYSDMTKYVEGEMRNVFPFTTKIPQHGGVDFHWKFNYEPNLTLKGTVNKREPKKLVSREPIYKNYKYEVLEAITHPNDRSITILLLASTDHDSGKGRCYVVIEDKGTSLLTPADYANEQFNALIAANLGKYSQDDLTKPVVDALPKEIISVVYDSNDNVLFGSSIVKGKVMYHYLDAKFTTDGIPLFLYSSVLYDGEGNADLPKGSLIMKYKEVKEMFPNN
jgi:hypothetical protein